MARSSASPSIGLFSGVAVVVREYIDDLGRGFKDRGVLFAVADVVGTARFVGLCHSADGQFNFAVYHNASLGPVAVRRHTGSRGQVEKHYLAGLAGEKVTGDARHGQVCLGHFFNKVGIISSHVHLSTRFIDLNYEAFSAFPVF